MLDRRRFTFGALLAAVAAPAVARQPLGEVQAAAAPTEPPSEPLLRPRFEVSQRGDELVIHLTLANRAPEPLSVLAKLGSRLGPQLSVHRIGAPEGELLAEVVKIDRTELVSRVGPRPTYVTLAAAGEGAGAELDVGTYRFHAPEGPVGEVEVTLIVPSGSGALPYPPQRLVVGGKAGA